jgi:hypothetical protein
MDPKPELEGESLFRLMTRFWSFVDVRDEGECWPWRGACNSSGYGRFKADGKDYKAHRVSRSLLRGDVHAGVVVRHSCDNPGCCNPAHLLTGTQADNVADRQARGRQAKGPRNGRWNPLLHQHRD